jgi:hypothetical protein
VTPVTFPVRFPMTTVISLNDIDTTAIIETVTADTIGIIGDDLD